MTALTDKLALLNSLRAVAGKAPLASWKNSVAELDQRILDMTPAQDLVHVAASKPIDPDLVKIVTEAIDAGTPIVHVPTGATSKKPTKDLDKRAAKKAAKVERAITKALPKVEKVKPVKAPRNAKGQVVIKKSSLPKSGNEFGEFLKANKLDPKQARATLRRKGFSAPYTLTTELKAALKVDARKK